MLHHCHIGQGTVGPWSSAARLSAARPQAHPTGVSASVPSSPAPSDDTGFPGALTGSPAMRGSEPPQHLGPQLEPTVPAGKGRWGAQGLRGHGAGETTRGVGREEHPKGVMGADLGVGASCGVRGARDCGLGGHRLPGGSRNGTSGARGCDGEALG